MKVRIGFVSNSSSSSFVLRMKVDESPKDIIEHNRKVLSKYYDKEYCDDHPEELEGKKIMVISSVEYGGEDSVEKIVKEVLKNLGYKDPDLEIEWTD